MAFRKEILSPGQALRGDSSLGPQLDDSLLRGSEPDSSGLAAPGFLATEMISVR